MNVLQKAAQRHADDLAMNVLFANHGHTGSDGSSTEERINDSDYFLWVTDYQLRISGENIQSQQGFFEAPVETAINDWKGSPEHWANILNEYYTEIGIGVSSYQDVTVFVTVFGGIPDRWSGFAPMDTTELEAFMNKNFTWSGEENKRRVPKLYLA